MERGRGKYSDQPIDHDQKKAPTGKIPFLFGSRDGKQVNLPSDKKWKKGKREDKKNGKRKMAKVRSGFRGSYVLFFEFVGFFAPCPHT